MPKLNPNRCAYLYRLETWPFAKRCEKDRIEGSRFCEPHHDEMQKFYEDHPRMNQLAIEAMED